MRSISRSGWWVSAKARLPQGARIFRADMTDFSRHVPPASIDFAFNPINTVRHLQSDRAMLATFAPSPGRSSPVASTRWGWSGRVRPGNRNRRRLDRPPPRHGRDAGGAVHPPRGADAIGVSVCSATSPSRRPSEARA